jgi:hypothetical protein
MADNQALAAVRTDDQNAKEIQESRRVSLSESNIHEPIARLPNSREGWLQEERRKILPLKNGGQIEAAFGLAGWRSLEHLLEQSPQNFRALLAIAEGRPGDADAQSIAHLSDSLFLRPDGSLEPGMRDVLLSSHTVTSEGSVLVNPFRLDTSDQAHTLEQIDDTGYQWLRREIRRTDESNKDRKP